LTGGALLNSAALVQHIDVNRGTVGIIERATVLANAIHEDGTGHTLRADGTRAGESDGVQEGASGASARNKVGGTGRRSVGARALANIAHPGTIPAIDTANIVARGREGHAIGADNGTLTIGRSRTIRASLAADESGRVTDRAISRTLGRRHDAETGVRVADIRVLTHALANDRGTSAGFEDARSTDLILDGGATLGSTAWIGDATGGASGGEEERNLTLGAGASSTSDSHGGTSGIDGGLSLEDANLTSGASGGAGHLSAVNVVGTVHGNNLGALASGAHALTGIAEGETGTAVAARVSASTNKRIKRVATANGIRGTSRRAERLAEGGAVRVNATLLRLEVASEVFAERLEEVAAKTIGHAALTSRHSDSGARISSRAEASEDAGARRFTSSTSISVISREASASRRARGAPGAGNREVENLGFHGTSTAASTNLARGNRDAATSGVAEGAGGTAITTS